MIFWRILKDNSVIALYPTRLATTTFVVLHLEGRRGANKIATLLAPGTGLSYRKSAS